MTDTTVNVHFKQTGESIDVPVASKSTMEEIIQYVCQQSIKKNDIDWNNYYLVFLNNSGLLDNDSTVEETRIISVENPRLQLCLKTAIREQMLILAKHPSRAALEDASFTLETSTDVILSTEINENDDILSLHSSYDSVSNEPPPGQLVPESGTDINPTPTVLSDQPQDGVSSDSSHNNVPPNTQHVSSTASPADGSCYETQNLKNLEISEPVATPVNLESNMSNPGPESLSSMKPAQREVNSGNTEVILSDDVPKLSPANALATGYRHVQSAIQYVSRKATRDPMTIQNISTMFNEINIVFCGPPRVGKSTLINAICGKEVAKASAGLDSCTRMNSRYIFSGSSQSDSETINYQYNFWDTPGLEEWTEARILEKIEAISNKPKSDILCMIYCVTMGSFVKLDKLNRLLQECMKKEIFCALVCTNKWAGQESQRYAVMKDLEKSLAICHPKTREENGVIYFGNKGLCTAVNSEKFDSGKASYEQSGINELICGIMESLDHERLAQWCAVVFENKPFWKSLFNFPEKLKTFWNTFFNRS